MSAALEPEIVLSLDRRKERIVDRLQNCALDIGEELICAKRDHPGGFMAWVEESLPFGLDKAERMMAIHRAFFDAEPEVRELLPAAWSALFELSRMPSERFQAAVEDGEVHPGLTVADSRALADRSPEILENYSPPKVSPPEMQAQPGLTCNLVAKALIQLPREDLSVEMAENLRTWLEMEV